MSWHQDRTQSVTHGSLHSRHCAQRYATYNDALFSLQGLLVGESMKIALITILLLMAACSSPTDHEFSRTLHVSAERLAEIKSKPYVKRYRSGGGPAARLAGLDDDPWPDGILFMEYGPYLEGLGFAKRQMLVEIDGKSVHVIFNDRWKKKSIRRPAGFHKDHYEDLIRYPFDKEPGDQVVVTMYLNVPDTEKAIGSYSPEVEYWQIVFDN